MARYLTDEERLWEVIDSGPTSFTVTDACDLAEVPRREVLSRSMPQLRAVKRATNAETDAWVEAWRARLQELEACLAGT
jgi:hypothetical protein